jgi:hypothetical protein
VVNQAPLGAVGGEFGGGAEFVADRDAVEANRVRHEHVTRRRLMPRPDADGGVQKEVVQIAVPRELDDLQELRRQHVRVQRELPGAEQQHVGGVDGAAVRVRAPTRRCLRLTRHIRQVDGFRPACRLQLRFERVDGGAANDPGLQRRELRADLVGAGGQLLQFVDDG